MHLLDETMGDVPSSERTKTTIESALTHRVRVTSVRAIADRIREVTLGAVGSDPLPTWAPGAHIDLLLQPGLSRPYSLCGFPRDSTWRIAVREEVDGRGGSRYVHETLRVGDELTVVGPRNDFPLHLDGRPMIFVAGGIGVTPILPMVAAADLAGADWRLIHLSRSAAAATYLDELARYGNRVLAHLDTDGGPLDIGAVLAGMGDGVDLYGCGPAPLLAALEDYARSKPSTRLFLERFENREQLRRPGDHAFVVETADGAEIGVAADQTIRDALEGAGIRVLTSCQEGVCGTCETAVLDGIPDHRDSILSEEERAAGETMMVCVSRCKGQRLILDV